MKKSIVFALVLALASGGAHADLQADLSAMWSSNSTSGGAYQSATRGGYVGGSFVARVPIKPITLATFDPPRINAGCAGIDMYGGSFSFINASQFTQLLRNIMNNAQGLLFKAALHNISPSIDDLLSYFQKTTQDLNALAANTCQIANQVINSVSAGALDTDAKTAGAKVANDIGLISDRFGSFFSGSEASAKSQNQSTEAKNPNAGNLVWRALSRNQMADEIGAAASVAADTNMSKQLMMSLLGTQISTSNQTGTNASLASDGGIYGPIISINDLVTPTNLKVYSCAGTPTQGDADVWAANSCTTITTTPYAYAGTTAFVRNMLWGDDTKTDAAGIGVALGAYSPDVPGPNSIFGKIKTCNATGCNLSSTEKSFLLAAGPIYRIMRDAQLDPASLPSISPLIENRLALMMAVKIGDATLRVARTAWNGVKDVARPAIIDESVRTLSQQLESLRVLEAAYDKDIERAVKIADEIRKNINVGLGR